MSEYPRTLRIDDARDEFVLEVALEIFESLYRQQSRSFQEAGADDRLVQGFAELEGRAAKLVERLQAK